jgi:NAD kinase
MELEELLSKTYLVDNEDKRTEREHEATRRSIHNWLYRNASEVVALGVRELDFEIFSDASSVWAVGGDGTLLGVSHHIKNDAVLVGVKSNSRSVGYLCELGVDKPSMSKLEEKSYRISELARIKIVVNGEFEFPYHALNDVYLTNASKPRRMLKYELETKSFEEYQEGDTLVFCTGAGSTAYLNDLQELLNHAPYSQESDLIRFGLYARYKGRKRFGDLKDGWARVNIKTIEGAYFAVDGQKVFDLMNEEFIEISLAKKLRMLKII